MKITDRIKIILKESKLILFILILLILIVESFDRCAGGIAYQLHKLDFFIKPAIGNVTILMKEGWAPILKSNLSDLGPTIIDIRFDKIRGCSAINTINIQSTNFDQKQVSNIKNKSEYILYPWGNALILNEKSKDGRYMIFLEDYNLVLFTKELANLDEVSEILFSGD